MPLAYLPGNVTRVKVTVVGDLQPPQQGDESAVVWNKDTEERNVRQEEGKKMAFWEFSITNNTCQCPWTHIALSGHQRQFARHCRWEYTSRILHILKICVWWESPEEQPCTKLFVQQPAALAGDGPTWFFESYNHLAHHHQEQSKRNRQNTENKINTTHATMLKQISTILALEGTNR